MAGKRVSLSELMGKSAASAGGSGKLNLSILPEILGDAMPDLPRTSVGRHRLIRSLQQRFGGNFRTLPGVADLVKEFDSEIAFEQKRAKIAAIKYKPPQKDKK